MVLIRIGVLVLMVLYLTVGLGFGQNNAEQIFNEGVEHAAQGKFKEAKKEFQKALEIDPSDESIKRFLTLIEDVNEKRINRKAVISFFNGLNFAGKGEWTSASVKFNEAIELTPQFVEAYYFRGISYFSGGRFDQCISDLTKVIEIDNRHAFAYRDRGTAYLIKGQHDKAISDYTKAIEINPRDAYSYSNRGVAYDAKGDMIKACSNWKRACELGNCSNWGIINKMRCLGK